MIDLEPCTHKHSLIDWCGRSKQWKQNIRGIEKCTVFQPTELTCLKGMFLFYWNRCRFYIWFIYSQTLHSFIHSFIEYTSNIHIHLLFIRSHYSILSVAEWRKKKKNISGDLCFYFILFDFFNTLPGQTNHSTSACRHRIIVVVVVAAAAVVDHSNILYWEKE